MEKKHEQSVDIALLNQAFAAFNDATVKLQSSYELLQDEARKLREEIEEKNIKLSGLSNLLESVLNNTNSAILVLDNSKEIVIKNLAGQRLIDDLGLDPLMGMIAHVPMDGIVDYDYGDDRHFRLSIGELHSDSLHGRIYVIDEITKLKKLEQEKQQGEKLKLMGEMVANIAHEIRNPLGSIELFASLLERDLSSDPDNKRLTVNIVKGVRSINSVISNTLLFTKDMHIKTKRVLVADIVDDVVLYLQHILKDKKIILVNQLNEEHSIDCDVELFRQVVMNLLHNAIDAAPATGGEVIVSSAVIDGEIRLSIRDNGTGIDKEMKNRLFMPFQTTKAKGTGLGLSIAYKIVKAHGGNIEFESDGKSYTVVVVTVPYLNGEC